MRALCTLLFLTLSIAATPDCSISQSAGENSFWQWENISSSIKLGNPVADGRAVAQSDSRLLGDRFVESAWGTRVSCVLVLRVEYSPHATSPRNVIQLDVSRALRAIPSVSSAAAWAIVVAPPKNSTLRLVGCDTSLVSRFAALRIAEKSLLEWTAPRLPVLWLDASDCTLVVPRAVSLEGNRCDNVTHMTEALLLDRVAYDDGDALLRSLAAMRTLRYLSLNRAQLRGNPLMLVHQLPSLENFDANENEWAFHENESFAVSSLPVGLRKFHVSTKRFPVGTALVGSGASLSLSASCNRTTIASSQYLPQVSIDVAGHTFTAIVLNASEDALCVNDQEDNVGDATVLAVVGVNFLNASLMTPGLPTGAISVEAIGFGGVALSDVHGNHFVDNMRLIGEAHFTGTPLSMSSSELIVDTGSPNWLCGSTYYCRNMSLNGCGVHASLLNLSNIGSNWLVLDLRGNVFDSVVQPLGLQTTEPVLLDQASCDAAHPCYVGGFARCTCQSASSSDAETPEPAPSQPLWKRRDVWIAGSSILAMIVLFTAVICVLKSWCKHGSGAMHGGYMSIDHKDIREEELNIRDDEGQQVHWSQEDEAAILCDAQECLFMFDQYVIFPGALGDGTTAKVFKVMRKADRQTLAMKRYSFRASQDDEDPSMFAAFEWMELFKEFWLLRHIDHPNVIRIEEVFISFYDALAAHQGNDVTGLGSFSSSPLTSSSTIQSGKQRLSDTHYPPESLTDNLTPFLLAVDKVRSHDVPNRAMEQQNRSRRYCYIFMSYIPDGTLISYFNQRRGEEARQPGGARSSSTRGVVDNRTVMCEEEALGLALQLFQALEYLHDPHRRRYLWTLANGGGHSRAGVVSEAGESSSRFLSKPNILSSLSAASHDQVFSSASFASALSREPTAAAVAASQRAASQLLMEDGPILHRDVKPDNLLIHRLPGHHVGPFTQRRYPNARLVLTDFGFADFYRQGVHVSHKGAPPAYAAPEVVRGRPSPACDVFSAGVVLFEMLSTSRAEQRHHGHFSTGVSRPSYVDKQKGLLRSLGIREETVSFLFQRVLLYDPVERCTAAQAVQELRLLLAPPMTS